MLKNTEQRYGSLSIGLHWLTLLLMIAVYALMEFRDIFPKGSAGRDLMKEFHFMVGLLILALVVVRLLVRAGSPSPRIVPELSPDAHAGQARPPGALWLPDPHPAAGLAAAERGRQAHPLLRPGAPALIAPDDGLKGTIKELHETLANIGYALIALHAAAAIYHHHVLKDNTLTNMLPERRS